jgi:hypothetical protein
MSINLVKKGFNIKDDKGHKIVAAVYLVTRHLSDTDPLKTELRKSAIGLLSMTIETRGAYASELLKLLETAVLIGVVGEKNASIISYEAARFVQDELDLPVLYQTEITQPIKDTKKTDTAATMSFIKKLKDTVPTKMLQKDSNRGDKILSFMKEKKSATIKDIVTLFPSVSEKTIQRELGALVQNGSISKRGNKRWSVYFYETL